MNQQSAISPQIILASTSPRRQELLKSANVDFKIWRIDIDESQLQNESAVSYINRMILAKADATLHMVTELTLILTADTIGVLPSGEILTKPIDKTDAFRMWSMLSNNTHEIWTAVCATLAINGAILHQKSICCATKVKFIALNHQKMQAYWQTGEPQDKAGAYAIQGGAMAWVESIEGSYTNVVGLPLAQTLALIDELLSAAKEN